MGEFAESAPSQLSGIEFDARGVGILSCREGKNRGETGAEEELARYRLNYTDGSHYEFPVQAGVHVYEWYFDATSPLHQKQNADLGVVWSGKHHGLLRPPEEQNGCLFFSSFPNPHPGKNVESLDLLSTLHSAGVFIVAISAH